MAGGEPYLLPHVPNLTGARAEALMAPMDALVVSGGAFDLDPALYGQAKHPLCGQLAPQRTSFETELLQAALAAGLPILGVCGGMQLMAILDGGTLHQDLTLRPGTDVHEQKFDKRQPSHPVTVAQGSLLHRLTGAERFEVNSTHHQIIASPGGYRVSAESPDGVIEAIEHDAHGYRLGVQWHPEVMADDSGIAIYKGLVQAARAKL